MTAGPTPLPPEVSQVQAEPILYHRAPAFIEVYARCLQRLKMVFETENDVLCFASSGSGGMESAVANLGGAGPAVVASCRQVRRALGRAERSLRRAVRALRRRLGDKVEPAELERVLSENEGTKVVFTTLSETSTGVVNESRRLPRSRTQRQRSSSSTRSRPRRVPCCPGRVGRRCASSRLAEGADVPARPRLRKPQRARARAAPASVPAAASTSTGRRPRRASARIRRTARSPRRCRSSWPSTSRSA